MDIVLLIQIKLSQLKGNSKNKQTTKQNQIKKPKMQVFFLSLFDFSNKETQKPLLYILYKFYSFFFSKKKKKKDDVYFASSC